MEMTRGDAGLVPVFVDRRFHRETCPRGVGMAHDSVTEQSYVTEQPRGFEGGRSRSLAVMLQILLAHFPTEPRAKLAGHKRAVIRAGNDFDLSVAPQFYERRG